MKSLKFIFLLIMGCAGLASMTEAQARFSLGVAGGLSYAHGSAYDGYAAQSTLFSGELGYSFMRLVHLGGFFEYNAMTDASDGSQSLSFYGLLVRLKPAFGAGLFFDFKVGINSSSADLVTSGSVGVGVASGYLFSVVPGLFELGPQFSARALGIRKSDVTSSQLGTFEGLILAVFAI